MSVMSPVHRSNANGVDPPKVSDLPKHRYICNHTRQRPTKIEPRPHHTQAGVESRAKPPPRPPIRPSLPLC